MGRDSEKQGGDVGRWREDPRDQGDEEKDGSTRPCAEHGDRSAAAYGLNEEDRGDLDDVRDGPDGGDEADGFVVATEGEDEPDHEGAAGEDRHGLAENVVDGEQAEARPDAFDVQTVVWAEEGQVRLDEGSRR